MTPTHPLTRTHSRTLVYVQCSTHAWTIMHKQSLTCTQTHAHSRTVSAYFWPKFFLQISIKIYFYVNAFFCYTVFVAVAASAFVRQETRKTPTPKPTPTHTTWVDERASRTEPSVATLRFAREPEINWENERAKRTLLNLGALCLHIRM